MDRTVALAVEHETSSPHFGHLRLAELADDDIEELTRVFESGPHAMPLQENSSQGPLCHGGGTESTTTTTAIDSEPAPAIVAEQAPSMDELIDIEEEHVREVLEGRLELEPSRPGSRAPRADTVVSTHVPRMPASEGTQMVATVLVDPIVDRTHMIATVLREPAPEGTRVVATVLREPAAVGTNVAATVLRDPTAPISLRPSPVPAPPLPRIVAPAPVVIAASASAAPAGVPQAIPEPPLPAATPVVATHADITSVQLRVAGRYLGDAVDGDAIRHKVGSSLVLSRAPGSPFENDPYVDAQHAALTFRPDGVTIDDFDSTNGVFVRVQGKLALRSGDVFRIGEELLRYSAIKPTRTVGRAPAFGSPDPGYWARVDVLLTPEDQAASYPIDDAEATFGQTDAHLQFPDDPFLDATHARIVKHERGALLEDLGSATGTWLRLRSGDVVPYGSELLVGGTRVVLDRG